MTAFQYKDEIIVVDAGLTFPEDEHLGIDVIIPDFSYLESNRHKIKGLLLTHGHERSYRGNPLFLPKVRDRKYTNVRWKINTCTCKGKI